MSNSLARDAGAVTMSRVAALAGSALCVSLPFLAVRFPPSTDLPQHLSQVRLFWSMIGAPDPAYRIQWLTPYSLVYALLSPVWALATDVYLPRLALLAVALAWLAGIHFVAAQRQRPMEAAILASVFVFNPSLYWGFLSFAIGWPVFALWLVWTARPTPTRGVRDHLRLLGGAVLLYMAHALWLGVGTAWLALEGLICRRPPRELARRFVSISPVLIWTAIWYPTLAAGGFNTPTYWGGTPIGHFSYSWLVDAALGGIRGPAEYAVLAAAVAWVGLSKWQRKAMWWGGVDRALLAAAAMFAALTILLPYRYMNTLQFGQRWCAPGLMLLLLATPPPVLRPRLRQLAAAGVLAALCVATTLAWMRFDRDELSGLSEAIAALPSAPRVLGLDFMQQSAVVKPRPFLQTFDYAQVFRGGRGNFSFAEFPPSLVVDRVYRQPPWTDGLEWNAEQVTAADFGFFDYAIIGGNAEVHAAVLSRFPLDAVTTAGVWRLYTIRHLEGR